MVNINKTGLRAALAAGIAIALAAPGISQIDPGPGNTEGNPGRPGLMRFSRSQMAGGGPDVLVMPPGDFMRLGEQLNLSDTQKTTIQGVARSKMDSIKQLNEQIPPLQKKISDQMLTSAPDAASVKATVAQVHQIRQQVANIGVDYWVAVRKVLTAEQNAQLTELLKRRMVPRIERPGMNPGWPDGRRGGPGNPAGPPPPGDGAGPPPPGAPVEPDPGP